MKKKPTISRHRQSAKHYQNLYKDYKGTFLYLIRCDSYHKIGVTFNLDNRLNSLQCGNPYKLELVFAVKCKDANECEEILHAHFENKKHLREWFSLTDEDVEFIKQLVD